MNLEDIDEILDQASKEIDKLLDPVEEELKQLDEILKTDYEIKGLNDLID